MSHPIPSLEYEDNNGKDVDVDLAGIEEPTEEDVMKADGLDVDFFTSDEHSMLYGN